MGNELSSPLDSAVYQASRRGNSVRIQSLFSQEMDPERRRRLADWQDGKGRTPLIIAAQKGHVNCVLELLRHDVDVHHISMRDFGGSALHEAVYYKWRSNGIVEALMRHGANPFVRNEHNRTVLDLCLIDNAPKDIYTPWLISFDRYGYFADELMVRTQFLHADVSWLSRWVTVVPLYTTSNPNHMQSLKKTMVIYDGYSTRAPVSYIDLTDAHAELASDRLRVMLGPDHRQPIGVASSKEADSVWSISLSATFGNGVASLNRLKTVINEDVNTIIEDQLQMNVEGSPPIHPTVQEGQTVSSDIRSNAENENDPCQDIVSMSIADVNAAHISVYNGAGDDSDINGGICVVCLDKPQSAGFLHGDCVHRCVCDSCAFQIYLSDRNQCPICRRKIDRILTGLH